MVLFHHDPMRDDPSLTRLVEACRQRVQRAESSLVVSAAAEGETIQIAVDEGDLMPATRSVQIESHHEGEETPVTILIADDDPDLREGLEAALRPEGYRLISCENGLEALGLVRTERPDLLLLDWQMPKCDGIEVCRQLRADPDATLRTMPVLMLTAMVTAEHTATGFSAGVTDYITKPTFPALIRSKVQQWVVRSRRARAL